MGGDSTHLRRLNVIIYCVLESLMSPNSIHNMLSQIYFSLLVFFIHASVYAQ